MARLRIRSVQTILSDTGHTQDEPDSIATREKSMQVATRRLSGVGIVVAITTLISCRPNAGGASGAADSTAATEASASARADSVVLRTDKNQYRAGEKMTLTLENKSAASFTFNPCARTLERQDGAAWTPVPEEGRMCTMEAWVLDPNGTRSGATDLPPSLAPGRYRVVVRLTREQTPGAASAAVTVVSEPVMVS
jgi:hypothetical protein